VRALPTSIKKKVTLIKHASHLEYPGSHNDYKKELSFAKAQIQLSKYAPASLSEIC